MLSAGPAIHILRTKLGHRIRLDNLFRLLELICTIDLILYNIGLIDPELLYWKAIVL